MGDNGLVNHFSKLFVGKKTSCLEKDFSKAIGGYDLSRFFKVENAANIKTTWREELRILETFHSIEPELLSAAVEAVPSRKSMDQFNRYSLLHILTALQLIRQRKGDILTKSADSPGIETLAVNSAHLPDDLFDWTTNVWFRKDDKEYVVENFGNSMIALRAIGLELKSRPDFSLVPIENSLLGVGEPETMAAAIFVCSFDATPISEIITKFDKVVESLVKKSPLLTGIGSGLKSCPNFWDVITTP